MCLLFCSSLHFASAASGMCALGKVREPVNLQDHLVFRLPKTLPSLPVVLPLKLRSVSSGPQRRSITALFAILIR